MVSTPRLLLAGGTTNSRADWGASASMHCGCGAVRCGVVQCERQTGPPYDDGSRGDIKVGRRRQGLPISRLRPFSGAVSNATPESDAKELGAWVRADALTL